jgi:hypothetical protein
MAVNGREWLARQMDREGKAYRRQGNCVVSGPIQKVPRPHRYHVTDSGRSILVAVLTTAPTSVHQLNQLSGRGVRRKIVALYNKTKV